MYVTNSCRAPTALLALGFVCSTAAGCGKDAARSDMVSVTDGGEFFCSLGSKWPARSVINPDNPDFEDANWTKAEVVSKFAAAKAASDPAYRAYKAATSLTDVLPCAFCPCGCSVHDAHLSGIDCFKDMHGFG